MKNNHRGGVYHAHSRQVLSAINHMVFYHRGGKEVFYLCPHVGLSQPWEYRYDCTKYTLPE